MTLPPDRHYQILFHDNMNAKFRIDGEILKEIEVENGLWNG